MDSMPTAPSPPPTPFSEREQHLLGKYLLAQLSPDERREFESTRATSDTLRAAVNLIEQTTADATLLSTGVPPMPAGREFPDFYEPKRLAANLRRVNRFGPVLSGGLNLGILALGMQISGVPFWISVSMLLIGLGTLVVAELIYFYPKRCRQFANLARGGATWHLKVAQLRALETFAKRPSTARIGWGLMVWAATGGPTCVVLLGHTSPLILAVTATMLIVVPAIVGALFVGLARTFHQSNEDSKGPQNR